MRYCDYAHNLVMTEERVHLDVDEVRDVFFEFTCALMKNYHKYLRTPAASEYTHNNA